MPIPIFPEIREIVNCHETKIDRFWQIRLNFWEKRKFSNPLPFLLLDRCRLIKTIKTWAQTCDLFLFCFLCESSSFSSFGIISSAIVRQRYLEWRSDSQKNLQKSYCFWTLSKQSDIPITDNLQNNTTRSKNRIQKHSEMSFVSFDLK